MSSVVGILATKTVNIDKLHVEINLTTILVFRW